MKLLKKILMLGATLATCLGLGVASACGETGGSSLPDVSSSESNSSGAQQQSFVYRVSLQNTTGFGFSNATVKLMDGDEVVATKKTNASGNANFLQGEVTPGSYKIVVEDIPAGYVFVNPSLTYKTSTSAGTSTVVEIEPTGILKGEIPAKTQYKLGSVVYDFTLRLADGKEYTLSQILEEKDMVLLNFWATWCSPCLSEFPAMHNAATAYTDSVSVLAVSVSDSADAVKEFQTNNKYEKFNMAAAGSGNLGSLFGVVAPSGAIGAVPQTFIIDRYGVVAYHEEGSMPSVSAFTSQFDKFVGEDYIPLVIGQNSENEGGGNEGGNEQMKPTGVTAPAISDLKEAFVDASANGFNFRFQEEEGAAPGDKNYDEYNWPWLIGSTESGDKYVYPSNGNVHNSYSILYSTFTAKEGDVVTFDYKLGTETDADILYIMLDGEIIKKYSGYHLDEWTTDYAYVFRDYEADKHEIAFVFIKDSDKTANDDIVYLRNLRLLNVAEIVDSPEVSADIFRYAATDLNTEENATTQFKNYVQLVEPGTGADQSGDEYYHVKNADGSVGPVLYANMMNASPWNKTSVWILAYEDYVVGDGINYHTAMEEYAWQASQITAVSGYAPVTKDLKYLLDVTVQYVTYMQKWEGEYHENEWLELCVYWEHYGDTPYPEDPMATITFSSAVEIYASENCTHEGDCKHANRVSIPTLLKPRGFKYKFIPEKSGAYKVYSVGTKNTQTFLMASDRETTLGFWDNKIFVSYVKGEDGKDYLDENFEYYWYFEAGETYYMLFATYMDEFTSYDVYIDYLGDSYVYLENAAIGPYSVNLNTFELFLPDAIEYAYSDPAEGGDGYYHHVKKDGSLGGIIYLDVNRPTAFFNDPISLYDICRQAEESVSDITKRALYVNGYDYTTDVKRICAKAMLANNDYVGFAPVDKDLFNLLNTIVRSDKYEGIYNSWLLLCYYVRTVAAGN